jgi:hypothetical protein
MTINTASVILKRAIGYFIASRLNSFASLSQRRNPMIGSRTSTGIPSDEEVIDDWEKRKNLVNREFEIGDLIECVSSSVLPAKGIRGDLAIVVAIDLRAYAWVCLQKNNERSLVPRWRWEVVE